MTHEQWQRFLAAVDGELLDPPPVGFIIDSPWLPNWAGITILDYYASERAWFDANIKAIDTFPQVMFIPGFWSEYGMCTEPSAFGAKCVFYEDEFPFAGKMITGDPMMGEFEGFDRIVKPNPATDGLAPFVLQRLKHHQAAIEQAGHEIRFAVARGPLNVAGFLMGNTEFLTAMKMTPDRIHALLGTVTDFLCEWLQLQARTFLSVDAVLVLDDVVGFCGQGDFEEFAKPYLKKVFEAVDARVRMFHNDAAGLVCAPHLADIGVNLFNFSYEHPIGEMRELAGGDVALLGNIPPRDVLAEGTPQQVKEAVEALVNSVDSAQGIILSCGGGMPPGVPTANVEAFLEAAGYRR